MRKVFHAFEIDLNDEDMTDIGLYVSESDAVAAIAQYILFDMSTEHADYFLSGEVELPWGRPSAAEIGSTQLDWVKVEKWLKTHSALELVNWYRQAHPDLELFLIPRILRERAPILDGKTISGLDEDHFPFENAYIRRGDNLLPPA